MNEPDESEVLVCSAVLVMANEANILRLQAAGPPPWPRTHRCAFCGKLTSAAPVDVVVSGRTFRVPAYCAADACVDAAAEPARYSE